MPGSFIGLGCALNKTGIRGGSTVGERRHSSPGAGQVPRIHFRWPRRGRKGRRVVPGRRHGANRVSGELVRRAQDWAPLDTPAMPGGLLRLRASPEMAWLRGGPHSRAGAPQSCSGTPWGEEAGVPVAPARTAAGPGPPATAVLAPEGFLLTKSRSLACGAWRGEGGGGEALGEGPGRWGAAALWGPQMPPVPGRRRLQGWI